MANDEQVSSSREHAARALRVRVLVSSHREPSGRSEPQPPPRGTREQPETEQPRTHSEEVVERHGPREPEFPERDRREHHPEVDERPGSPEGDDSDVERGPG